MDRNRLIDLRPAIPQADISLANSVEEQFQNDTLRPILKLQHSLLISMFQHYFKERKLKMTSLSKEQQFLQIQQLFQKDVGLRNRLLGMIIGHFTEKEWIIYSNHEKEIRKRLGQLLVQRVQSQVENLIE